MSLLRLPRWIWLLLLLSFQYILTVNCGSASLHPEIHVEYSRCRHNLFLCINQALGDLGYENSSFYDDPITPFPREHTEAINILRMIQQDLLIAKQQQGRFLEAGDGSDDDDYFSAVYREVKNSDVSVSYDDEDNTIVTVGDDVIVYVEHEWDFYVFNIGMVLVCVVIGATMAGLLMGIMSLDPLMVGVKARTAVSDQERQQALTLLPFVQNKNLVLVSLLLVNCGTNEALPIYLDSLLDNPLLTVILSLTVVLIIGEIVPSAYFTGRDQVQSASNLVGILRFVIVITSPISYPLSKLMDYYFREGTEVSSLKRGELAAMVRIQYEENLASRRRMTAEDRKLSFATNVSSRSLLKSSVSSQDFHQLFHSPDERSVCNSTSIEDIPPSDSVVLPQVHSMYQNIGRDDVIRLEGALTMKDKKIEQIYTPMRHVISVLGNATLDVDMIAQIYSYGYSRLPVLQFIEGDNTTGALGVCGILLTKQLMVVGQDDGRCVASLTLYEPPCLRPDTSLAVALSSLLAGHRKASHMALVCLDPEMATMALRQHQPVPKEAGVLGIFTLENLLEALIQEPIHDEKDRKVNCFRGVERSTKAAIAKWKAFVQRRRTERDNSHVVPMMMMPPQSNPHPLDFIQMNDFV